jgi:hypothetical protein|tara:strand:- start:458 stop:1249 length:792 start_codon:yes stop_codon:yes gene_type:complete
MLAKKLGLSLPTIKTVGSGGGAAYSNVYSLDFDGTNDYVTFGDADVFSIDNTGTGFSISAWIKTTGTADTILAKNELSATEAEYDFGVGRDGKLNFYVYGGGGGGVFQYLRVDTPTVHDDNWHHVAVTFDLADATTSIIIYIDGVLYNAASAGTTYGSNGTWASPSNTTAPLQMGRKGTVEYFGGNIDEVAIYQAKLSGADVLAIYNSGTPTDLSGESNLVGYWRNGDTAGTSVYPTIEDYSSNSNDGTMTNMASGDIVTDVP